MHMFDWAASWALPQLTLFLVIGNFLGGIALVLGVGLIRDLVHASGHLHIRSRLTGVVLFVVGVAGWLVPWLVIWNWYHVR